jgi:hypothetical protein
MKPLNEQINPKFVRQAKRLSKVTQILKNMLPVECHNHVQVGSINRQILTLICDSPVWTTRLRQLSPQILQYINENKADLSEYLESPSSFHSNNSYSQPDGKPLIHHIQINTRFSKREDISDKRIPKIRQARPVLSQQSARLLAQSADDIKHERLKASLKKLARHAAVDND